mmetsp:Transcript_20963/g.49585  ORF Transcript_20963/g.49585 Transcript_20963/m.49585 type:complete len:394 (-) Transcript_20963:150-1331(-)
MVLAPLSWEARYLPSCAATCAVAGSGAPSMVAQSPSAYTLVAPLTWSLASVTSARKLFWTSRPMHSRSLLVMGRHLMPVAQTITDAVKDSFTLLPLRWMITSFGFTSFTKVSPRNVIPSFSKLSAVAFETSAENIPSILPVASTSWMFTSSFSFGNCCFKSSCSKSASSAAYSTPVGPPPTTTKLSSFLRASAVWPGLQALSNESMIAPRIALASFISLRKWAFSSTPGVLKVLLSAPTATTSLSYAILNSGLWRARKLWLTLRVILTPFSVALRSLAPLMKDSSFLSLSNEVHSASTKVTCGQMARIDSTIVRDSIVPTVTEGSSGVITKWLRGLMQTMSYLNGSSWPSSDTAPQPEPRTTTRSLRELRGFCNMRSSRISVLGRGWRPLSTK